MIVGIIFAKKMEKVLRNRQAPGVTWRQLSRLAKLPNAGMFSYLHHDLASEFTIDLRNRLDFICRLKRRSEIYERLFCIRLLGKRGEARKVIPNYKKHIVTLSWRGGVASVKGT